MARKERAARQTCRLEDNKLRQRCCLEDKLRQTCRLEDNKLRQTCRLEDKLRQRFSSDPCICLYFGGWGIQQMYTLETYCKLCQYNTLKAKSSGDLFAESTQWSKITLHQLKIYSDDTLSKKKFFTFHLYESSTSYNTITKLLALFLASWRGCINGWYRS